MYTLNNMKIPQNIQVTMLYAMDSYSKTIRSKKTLAEIEVELLQLEKAGEEVNFDIDRYRTALKYWSTKNDEFWREQCIKALNYLK